jgi:hypothetical protein
MAKKKTAAVTSPEISRIDRAIEQAEELINRLREVREALVAAAAAEGDQ